MTGDDFVTGGCDYSDFYRGRKEPLARIYVPFRPQGIAIRLVGLLDTGGHFCILSPDVVEMVGDVLGGSDEEASLLTSQGRLVGGLYRHGIELLAEEGENLELEATVFVSPDWRGPSVLGYTGVLDRVRFAVDPRANRFYFGSLD